MKKSGAPNRQAERAALTRRGFIRAGLAVGASGLMLTTGPVVAERRPAYFLEAEHFQKHGGWIVDPQFVDEMGSPYLLAHGLGRPVDDAITTLRNVRPGRYRLWVRTRDWTQETGESAGRFRVLADGKPVEPVFGTGSGDWGWQDGGVVDLRDKVELALHDLAGFDARCDCLWLSPDLQARPPEKDDEMPVFRLAQAALSGEPIDGGSYDLIVIGAGVAGICAAVGAARLGLRVALVECREVLGGNNSSRVRVHISAKTNMEPWPNLGNLVGEMSAARRLARPWMTEKFMEGDRQKAELVAAENNLTVLSGHHLLDVEKSDDIIASVTVMDLSRGRPVRLSAALFCDATGDGDLAYAAGCEYHIGRESRETYNELRAPEQDDVQVLGATLHWFSEEEEDVFEFPETPWALPINDTTAWPTTKSAWNWEAGYWLNQAMHGERTRDLLLRSIFGNWSFLKHDPGRRKNFRKYALQWCSYNLGRRESRRIMGDVVLTQNGIPSTGDKYPDAAVPCTWGIDVHVPRDKHVQHLGKRAFKSRALHNERGQTRAVMPYRSLYARDVSNCFLAGRCASMSHLAHAMFRCQGTTGMMGETVAMAAVVASEADCAPRAVYENHLDELKKLLDRGF